MREKRLLSPYGDFNPFWGKEMCISCRTKKERSGVPWFTLGIWILRGLRLVEGKEGWMSAMCAGGERIPPAIEVPRNAEVGRGAPEQQMATYQSRNCTQVDTHYQKCH